MHSSPSPILCTLCRGRFGLLVGVLRTGYENKTQARRSRVCTNYTCLLATLECSFIQVQIKFCFIALQAQRIRVGSRVGIVFSSPKFQFQSSSLSFIVENLIVILVLCISADDLDLMLSSLYSVP